MQHHFKLQIADRAQQQASACVRFEHLDRTFFPKLLQASSQLFATHRVGNLDCLKNLRRKIGQAGELQFLAFAQRVTQPQRTVVGNANDVAGKRFLKQFPSLREERYDGARADIFSGA